MRILAFESVPSTQDQAFELLSQGERTPFCVWAREQTRGRGRLDRVWISERDRSLTLSLAYRLPANVLSGLSLAIGLGILKCLPESAPLKLKWPNDIMLNDHKVGGILIESRSQSEKAEVVIGIGLNLTTLESAPYRGLDFSLAPEQIVEGVEEVMTILQTHGFEGLRERYETKLWRKGEVQHLRTSEGLVSALVQGVDEWGRLKTMEAGTLTLRENGEILVTPSAH